MGGGGGSNFDYRPNSTIDDVGAEGTDDARPGLDCESLTFEAPVMSPSPTTVWSLTVGTMCEVLLRGSPPQLRLHLRREGTLLGAITERWQDLTRCINAGFSFEAEVIQVTPVFRVCVRPRAPHTLTLPMRVALTDVASGTSLHAGDRHDVLLTPSDRVVVGSNIATALGRIWAEPVSLPEALRTGIRLSATVETDNSPDVVIERR